MVKDGIEAKTRTATGEKQWWLTQMIGAAPIGHWTVAWSATPAEIVASALESEWSLLLLEGWLQAAARQPVPEWIQPLLEAYPKVKTKQGSRGHLLSQAAEQLMANLPEQSWRAQLDARLEGKECSLCQKDDGFDSLMAKLRRLDSKSAQRLIRVFKQHIAHVNQRDYQGMMWLEQLASVIPPELFPVLRDDWPTNPVAQAQWEKSIQHFLDLLQFRYDIAAAF